MHSSTALGPAVGMVFAGKVTTIWVDYLDKGLEAPNNIDPSSKLWVGNWWLPFWIVSCFVFVLAIVVFAVVPEHLATFYPPEEVEKEIVKASDSRESELIAHRSNMTEATMKTASLTTSIMTTSTLGSPKKRSVRESNGY